MIIIVLILLFQFSTLYYTYSPAVVFIDEFQAIFANRESSGEVFFFKTLRSKSVKPNL